MRAPRRTFVLASALPVLVLVAGCGAGEPEAPEALEPAAPADLCSTVPAPLRKGLVAASNAEEGGHPTAACSLRSPDGARTERQAVVTWLQLDDEISAQEVWDSQCRAIDGREFRRQRGFRVAGADQACAGGAAGADGDAATLAAVSDRAVVTVRLSSQPARESRALAEGEAMLAGVLTSLSDRPAG